MLDDVDPRVNFSELAKKQTIFWKENNIFEKSLELSKEEHVFYDGPPFPTGAPHHGTIFVSILKDSLARYFTMAGKTVPRVWGWDCHGLPIENAIEKELGITNKNQIEEELGVKTFNDACRKLVSDCNDSWETYIDSIGRWVNYKDAYRTLDKNYMESVLWVFNESYKKDLIYKDFRVTPYCYRCETSLSISDTRESDSTRPRQDPSVVIKFKADEKINNMETYFLAWTTTPWTLTANMALAVKGNISYVALDIEGEVWILAEELVGKYSKNLGENPKVLKTFLGSELIGKSYEPLFPYFANLKQSDEKYFTVIEADFVTTSDGVGIVHTAPAFGEEDYWACKSVGIKVNNPVDSKGCFTNIVTDFAGKNVHDANKDVIRFLKETGQLIRQDTIEHNYPHCWRCRNPLIYSSMEAWYFNVEAIKDRLIKHNEKINWTPETVKHGRFGNWLKGARDWNISRNRYWGTPIPVWECESEDCDQRKVFGSCAELTEVSGKKITDLHKEFLDEITFDCECGSTMKRVPEVLDCWFESGSMPFGQCHYPFENKEWFEEHFPADFIVEYPGQIRGWFYYLHVLAVALLDRPSFKNCLVHGTLLAEDGSKISKSKKNYTDPMKIIETYGADALRIYLLNSPAATMADLRFKDADVEEQIKGVLLKIWNSYSFFVTYAKIDDYQANADIIPEPKAELDLWILAKLHSTAEEVKEAFETYHLNHSLAPVIAFIDNLTNWYIRRSRKRFWAAGFSEDKKSAFDTLYYVLINLSKILAPSAPFVTEEIFRNLTGKESVHLTVWPSIPEKFINQALVDEIELTQKIATLALAMRQKSGLKVRQPLRSMQAALPIGSETILRDSQIHVLKEELNVKHFEIIEDPSSIAIIRAVPNAKVLGPKYGKEIQFIIKAAREGNVKVEGENVTVFNDDKEWELSLEDISVGYQGKEGFDVTSDQGIVVSLDTQLDAELIEEGLANEINRIVQDMRKKAGYHVSDKIQLKIEGDLTGKSLKMIADSTLAEYAEITVSDLEENFEINQKTYTISIKKR